MKALIAGLVCLLFALPAFSGGVSGGTRKGGHDFKNLVLIMIDDVGQADLNINPGLISWEQPYEIPEMDAMRAQGLTMTNYNMSVACASSRVSILSGASPLRTYETGGATMWGLQRDAEKWPQTINNHRPVYNVGLQGKSGAGESQDEQWNNQNDPPASYTGPTTLDGFGYPFSRLREVRFGFDNGVNSLALFAGTNVSPSQSSTKWFTGVDEDDPNYDPDDTRTWWDTPYGERDYVSVNYDAGFPYYTDGFSQDVWTDDLIADAAIAFIRENRAKGIPFVTQLSFSTAHVPWMYPVDGGAKYCEAPDVCSNNQGLNEVSKMMEYVDKLIGMIVDEVDLRTTYVFVAGDNGSSLSTGSGQTESDKAHIMPNGLGTNVGAIVVGPGIKPGTTTPVMHSTVSWYPTVVELTGVPMPDSWPNVDDDGRYNGQSGPETYVGKSMVETWKNGWVPGSSPLSTTPEEYTGEEFVVSYLDNTKQVQMKRTSVDEISLNSNVTYYSCHCATEADKIKYCGTDSGGSVGLNEQAYIVQENTSPIVVFPQCTQQDCAGLPDGFLIKDMVQQGRQILSDEADFLLTDRTPAFPGAIPPADKWKTCYPDPY